MSQEGTRSSTKKWYVGDWPPLAWAETVLKLAAIVFGIVAFVQAVSAGAFSLPSGPRLAQFLVLAFLSLGLLVATFDRLAEREIVAMIFVILNNLGHWGMVVALAAEPGPGWMLTAFAALMLVGDLVKFVGDRQHVVDAHAGCQQGLVRVAQGRICDSERVFCHCICLLARAECCHVSWGANLPVCSQARPGPRSGGIVFRWA